MNNRSLVNRPAQRVIVTRESEDQPNLTPYLTVFMLCVFFVLALIPTAAEYLGYMMDRIEEQPLGFCAVVALLFGAYFAWRGL